MASSQPPQRRSSAEQEDLEKRIHQLMEHQVSFNEHLGFTISQLDAEQCAIQFEMRPELVGHYLYGRLHGGVISTVLDSVAGIVIMAALAEKHPAESADEVMDRFKYLGTIDLRIDYLRQGMGTRFTGIAKVTRLGRRIASTHMELYNEESLLLATGAGTYIVS